MCKNLIGTVVFSADVANSKSSKVNRKDAGDKVNAARVGMVKKLAEKYG
jgi:hypothetical protein